MGYRFKKRETFGAGVRRIAEEQLVKAIDEVDDRRLGPHASVHQARKRCKKVRALLRLVRPSLVGDTYVRENAWYRDTGREVAAVRDAQIRIETVDALRVSFGRLVSEEVFGRARTALVAQRDALLARRTGPERCLEDVCERLEEGLARIDTWRFERDGFDTVRGGFVRSCERACTAMRRAWADPQDERFHEWRKRVKDHRQHVRLLVPLWRGPVRAREKELHVLSELLGADHDLFVLETLANEEPGTVGGRDVERVSLALAQRRRVELRAAARPLGERLFAEKPKRIARRYEAWHDIWRAESRP